MTFWWPAICPRPLLVVVLYKNPAIQGGTHYAHQITLRSLGFLDLATTMQTDLKHHNQRTPMYATQHHSSKIRVTPTSSKSLRKFNSLEKTTAQPEYLMNWFFFAQESFHKKMCSFPLLLWHWKVVFLSNLLDFEKIVPRQTE